MRVSGRGGSRDDFFPAMINGYQSHYDAISSTCVFFCYYLRMLLSWFAL